MNCYAYPAFASLTEIVFRIRVPYYLYGLLIGSRSVDCCSSSRARERIGIFILASTAANLLHCYNLYNIIMH